MKIRLLFSYSIIFSIKECPKMAGKPKREKPDADSGRFETWDDGLCEPHSNEWLDAPPFGGSRICAWNKG